MSGFNAEKKFERVTVLGLGYVGLPVSAALASRGIEVVGVDTNPNVVATINSGNIHIVEPDLQMLVQAAVAGGKLRATSKAEESDAFIIAVPTPFTEDYNPDLSHVRSAVDLISPVVKKGDLVVLESTSPVGATELVREWLGRARPDLAMPDRLKDDADIFIAHCPERVLPGTVLRELMYNDRVIGGISANCAETAAAMYSLFVTGELHLTTSRTAEMAKLTENAFRDVNIAFANELAIICEDLHISVWDLIELANHHPRVNILSPGPGVGGHCIAVDPWFIISAAGEKAQVMRAARAVNDDMPKRVVAKIRNAAVRFKEAKVACFGLSYKPNIDDLRESPALKIVEDLASAGGDILVVEPNITELPTSLAAFGNVKLVSIAVALENADIIALLVNHRQFLRVDQEILDLKIVIDTRGIWRSSKPLRYRDPTH